MSLLKTYLLCCLVLVGYHVYSQEHDIGFVTYTMRDGLTDNTVIKTITDRNGMLWIATKNGLSRFDGINFTNYTYVPGDNNSLRSIWITDLLMDEKGLVWISTEGGLCYYDEKHDNFSYINKKETRDIQVLYKGPMCRGRDNTIWIAAEDGLLHVDAGLKTYTHTSLKRIADPQHILADKNGRVWIGTRGNGLYCYTIATNTYERVHFPVLIPEAHIMDLCEEGDSSIWAATSEGLLLIHHGKDAELFTAGADRLAGKTFSQFMCISPFAPLTGPQGLLCGTYDKHFLLFDKQKKAFVYQWENSNLNSNPNNIPNGIFYDLFQDNRILWIASDHGLSKLNMDEQEVVSVRIPELQDKESKALVKKIIRDARHPSVIWICLSKPQGGMIQYNLRENKITKTWYSRIGNTGNGPVRIYKSIHADSSGNIWAVADHCIDRFSAGGAVQCFVVPIHPISLDIDRSGHLWLGTDRGLCFFNPANGQYEVFNNSFNGTAVENSSFNDPFPVNDVKCDNKGTVWLASLKYGLFSFDIAAKTFTAHRQPFTGDYGVINRCDALGFDGSGKLWIGNMAGISCFDPASNRFDNYNSAQGLRSSYIYDLCIDTGNRVWCNGNTGLSMFDITRKSARNAYLPQEPNGSLTEEKIATMGNEVLVGFEGGFNIFNKTFNTHSPDLPAARITSCRVMDEKFLFDADSIAAYPASFSYRENTFHFDFTAPEYTRPEGLHFRYRLDGFDKEWKSISKPSYATYTNLPPGNYVFQVTTARDGFPINKKYAAFAFTIHSPFWKAGWFIVLVGIAAFLLIYLFYQYRMRQLKKFYQVRNTISSNLHDEMGATLSSINIYSAVGKSKASNTETRELLDRINSASAQLMESMNDIVWYVNPGNDSMENILVKMREYAAPVLEARGMTLHFNVARSLQSSKLSMEQRQHFYCIFKELINNSAKYAAARQVWVDITQTDKKIGLEVRDDGTGFDVRQVKRGNGLNNIQQRAAALKGDCSLQSEPGKGTTIRVLFTL